MKKLIVLAVALVFASLAPSLAAQTAGFTGKWEGTMTPQRADGTPGNPGKIAFDLTQKGKVLTGTAGPADQQIAISKGVVAAGKTTFEVQVPNGPLFKFTLALAKGRLQGEMASDTGGVARHAKVDAGKAAAPKKK
jgi:hypothetical protein